MSDCPDLVPVLRDSVSTLGPRHPDQQVLLVSPCPGARLEDYELSALTHEEVSPILYALPEDCFQGDLIAHASDGVRDPAPVIPNIFLPQDAHASILEITIESYRFDPHDFQHPVVSVGLSHSLGQQAL